MLSLYDRPVLEMVSLLFLELYQPLQYSYDCSSVMSVHPMGGGSARDTRVSLTSVDMVSRLAKCYWMSTIPTVCRGSVDAYLRHHWETAMAFADINGVAGIS